MKVLSSTKIVFVKIQHLVSPAKPNNPQFTFQFKKHCFSRFVLPILSSSNPATDLYFMRILNLYTIDSDHFLYSMEVGLCIGPCLWILAEAVHVGTNII